MRSQETSHKAASSTAGRVRNEAAEHRGNVNIRETEGGIKRKPYVPPALNATRGFAGPRYGPDWKAGSETSGAAFVSVAGLRLRGRGGFPQLLLAAEFAQLHFPAPGCSKSGSSYKPIKSFCRIEKEIQESDLPKSMGCPINHHWHSAAKVRVANENFG